MRFLFKIDQNYISKIELDSIIPTVKLIDDIISKREVIDLNDILQKNG